MGIGYVSSVLRETKARKERAERQARSARIRASTGAVTPATVNLRPTTAAAPAAVGGGGTAGTSQALTDLMASWEEKQESARLSNIERRKQIEAIYSGIIGKYEAGGAFEKAGLQEIETARTRGVGQEMQQMISSGLYGTTTAAGVPRKWETEVGQPARLRLEDIMMQRLTSAQTEKAGFMERIEEPYPDYATMAGLTQQAAAGPAARPAYSAEEIEQQRIAARERSARTTAEWEKRQKERMAAWPKRKSWP